MGRTKNTKINVLISSTALLAFLALGALLWFRSQTTLIGESSAPAESPVEEPSSIPSSPPDTDEFPVEAPDGEATAESPTFEAPILRPAPPPVAVPDPAPLPEVVDPVDEAVRRTNIREGQVAWNPPTQMVKDEAEIITVIISDDLERDLAAELREIENDPNTQATVSQILVATSIQTRLEGSNFSIELQSPQNQVLPKEDAAAWRWRVTPLEEGEQELSLSVYALIKYEDGIEREKWLQTYSEHISVEVDKVSFIGEVGQWAVDNAEGAAALGGALVAAATFVATQWKRLRKLPNQEESK